MSQARDAFFVLVAQALHFIEQVGRDCGTAQLGPDAFGELTPFGDGFRVGMNDVEPELLHERNGAGFRFADFIAQGDAGGARGLHHFFLHGRGNFVPDVFGDDGCAHQLRELNIEHVLRAAEPLVAESHQRRGLKSVDEAGLQAGEDVGGGEGNGKKAVDLIKLERGGVALQDAELHAANVVGTAWRAAW